MQHIKRPPVRNKINLAEPSQVRAWTKRLGVSVEVLKTIIERVGNSVSAVSKEVELQRSVRAAPPARPMVDPVNEGKMPEVV